MRKRIQQTVLAGALLCEGVCVMVACTGTQSKGNDSVAVEQTESKAQEVSVSDQPDFLTVSEVSTKYGDLICLKPDMDVLTMDLQCGGIPSAENDSTALVFAGAFTGTDFGAGHTNVAGDHVSGGKRYKGYYCKRNNGAFTWSPVSGPKFYYQDYSGALDKAASEDGMAFTQEMMIHNGREVKTTRPLDNENVFRALCLDSTDNLALYESVNTITFGDFINALLSQGVREALYTDMGGGWNYCFYRLNANATTPTYLHEHPVPDASNFVVLTLK